jgi:hypothetical protein
MGPVVLAAERRTDHASSEKQQMKKVFAFLLKECGMETKVFLKREPVADFGAKGCNWQVR